jgi:protein-S-isoprenylcysteine O-methyltransferase Ste14
MKVDFLAYKPPRIAMLLVAMAALIHWSLPLVALGPESMKTWGLVTGTAGFSLMMQAWWQFKTNDVAICPTANTSELITDGIYRFTRNPMYLGMVIMLAGIAMYAGTIPFYLAALGFIAILNYAFCPYEERKLSLTFGTHYADYSKTVRRWI